MNKGIHQTHQVPGNKDNINKQSSLFTSGGIGVCIQRGINLQKSKGTSFYLKEKRK
jgi:hypothetical protein